MHLRSESGQILHQRTTTGTDMRDINRSAILEVIRQERPISRTTIARRLGRQRAHGHAHRRRAHRRRIHAHARRHRVERRPAALAVRVPRGVYRDRNDLGGAEMRIIFQRYVVRGLTAGAVKG